MLHGNRVKSLPPVEERKKVFDNSLINLLQANFHSSHYKRNTSDSGKKGSKHSLSFQ